MPQEYVISKNSLSVFLKTGEEVYGATTRNSKSALHSFKSIFGNQNILIWKEPCSLAAKDENLKHSS